VVKRSIVIITYLAILTRSAIAAGIPESETIYFESSGHQVAVDLVRPAVSGRHPAILLLHGGSGMSFYRASFARRAQKLAGAGFSVLIDGDDRAPAAARIRGADFQKRHWQAAARKSHVFISAEAGAPVRPGA
jgi:hypothetical protein